MKFNEIDKAIVCLALATSFAAHAGYASAQSPPSRKASSADTATAQLLRLYLSPIRVDSGYRLTPNGYSGGTHVEQNVDFASRPDSAHVASVVGIATRSIDTWNGVQFISPPLPVSIELSGVFSGRLELISNKESFDFTISLYELTSAGDYILISSYSTLEPVVGKATQRMLLQTGTRQFLDYQSPRFADRLIEKGGRLLVLIMILKSPATVTTHLGGGHRPDDTNVPLTVGWYGDSYIELHVRYR
jgi:hypothetical protein